MSRFHASRFAAWFVLAALLLALVPATFAQETFGLSDTDFQLMTTANAMSTAAQSFDYDFTFTVNAAGGDMASNAYLMVTGNGEAGQDAFSIALNVAGTVDDENVLAALEARIVGDMLYVNVQNPTTGESSGWIGMSLSDLGTTLSQGFMEGFMEDNPLGLDPAAAEQAAQGDFSSIMQMEGVAEAMQALATLDPAEFVAMSRLGDETVNGANTAHFSTNVDLRGLLQSEAFISLAGMAITMNQAEEGSPTPEPEQVNAMATGAMAMIAAGIEQLDLNFDQYVGLDDGFVHRAVLNFGLNVDPTTFGSEGDPVTLALNFDINLSEYNQPINVAVPEGAQIIDMDDVMEGNVPFVPQLAD
jgi:hypothetical protein